MNNQSSSFGTVHYIIFTDIKMKICWPQPTVQSLVRLHTCAGWPGSVLVAKPHHFRFQEDKDYGNTIITGFLVDEVAENVLPIACVKALQEL